MYGSLWKKQTYSGGWCVWVRTTWYWIYAVTKSDFHSTIIVAKQIHSDDIIAISIEIHLQLCLRWVVSHKGNKECWESVKVNKKFNCTHDKTIKIKFHTLELGLVNQPNFPIRFDSDYWGLDSTRNKIINLPFNISQLLNYFTSLLSNTSQHLQYCIV